MDFFYKGVEAAQAQAKSLTASASQSAKGLAEQLSEHTRGLADAAASVGSEAGQRWKGLNLQDALQLKALQQRGAPVAGPPREQLEQYAVTPDFVEFIRSLTYSTFRDFPLEQLPELPAGDGAKALTPWQERHALLVVQEVKEINELRFVLCPKRMSDAQFWQVYFALARKFLPPEAYDREAPAEPSAAAAAAPQPLDLQASLRRTISAAREAARDWQSRASGSLRPQETSAQLHDLVESRSRGGTPKTPAGAAPDAFAAREDSAAPPAEPADLEHELEAYLQAISPEGAPGEGRASGGSEGSSGEAAVDLDEYLQELSVRDGEGAGGDAGDGSPGEGSEDAVDLEQYMQELQAEEQQHKAGS